MKCKCRECENKYENERDYKTSICNECFKKVMIDTIQPLRDKLLKIQTANSQLASRTIKLNGIEGRLITLMKGQDFNEYTMQTWLTELGLVK